MTEQDFINVIENIIYGIAILICIFILWSAWNRIRSDHRQGGIAQIVLTVVKVIIFFAVVFFVVQYADKQGYIQKLAKIFH